MGFAKGGAGFSGGDNLAIAGVQPSGMAAQGNVFWRAGAPVQTMELVASGYAVGGGNVLTLDTTGATLLVIAGMYYGTGSTGGYDSNGNTWIQAINNNGAMIFYCLNPVVGSNHTFTINAGYYPAIVVMAFKGYNPQPGQTVATTGNGASIQLPAISPVTPSTLLVVCQMFNDGGIYAVSVDPGFTIVQNVPVGSTQGGVAAYLATPQSSSIAPLITLNSPAASVTGAVAMAFNPA